MGTDGLTATFATSENDRGPKTLDFYISFANPDNDNYVWSDALGNDLELFANGKVAMMFAPSWRVFDVINLNPSLNFDVAALPQLPSSENTVSPTINWASYWGYAVSAKADSSSESWKFVKYLSQKETQQKFFTESAKIRAFGQIHSRKDLADNLKGQQYTDAFVTMAPTAKNWEMRDDVKAKELLGIAISSTLGGDNARSALEDIAIQLTNHLGGDPSLIR